MRTQNTNDLTERAEQIYAERYQAQLEKSHRDYFVAIEPDSGEFFLGQTMSEAASASRKAHPNRRAFILRVGHRTAVHLGACMS
ncbi:MAG: hypothetical protein ACJ8FY_24950 [Gemmataceae bacterium]